MHDDNLAGQVALVTGAGRGIGRAVALALAQAGASVAVTARTADELRETREMIRALQPDCPTAVLPGDVTDEVAVAGVVERAQRELGPVDLLVNDAGAQVTAGPLWESDPEEWWRAHEVNVKGTYLCSRAVAPGMIERGRGRIVNVASRAGVTAMGYASGYCCSKTAQVRLTELLAVELRQHGVFAFAIHPGGIDTRMNERFLKSPSGRRWFPGAERRLEPHADRAAALCVALASGKADVLTGRYFEVADDLDALLARADEVIAQDLYTLRTGKLSRG